MQLPITNIAAFPLPRLPSPPPIPASDLMPRVSKNWPPASRRKEFRPLLVRELEESKYEVVAGARRLRAAKLAELQKLPVRVVKLTDAEAIEAQCVENLQREDIRPAGGSSGVFEVALGTGRTCLHHRHHRLTRWQERGCTSTARIQTR